MQSSFARWIILWVVLMTALSACRSNPPTPTSPAPDVSPTTAPDSPPPPSPSTKVIPTRTLTPTPSPPTPTPLPTWPDRWEPTGGPAGGLINAIVIDPANTNRLYAAGAGGAVYKSDDGGETWSPGERLTAPDCPFSGLVMDAANTDLLYAASSCGGIFKSSDAGTTWTRADQGIKGDVSILVQPPPTPNLLLAASGDGQVFRSIDGAATWEPLGEGLPEGQIRSLVASGPELYWILYGATTGDGEANMLYRFVGGGWSAAPLGQPPEAGVTNLFVDPDNPDVIYIGLEQVNPDSDNPAHLLRSVDGGYTWLPLYDESDQFTGAVYVLGKDRRAGLLYVADNLGLLASPDGGDTWQRLGPLPHSPTHLVIDPADSNRLFLPLQTGVARSTDGGRSWEKLNTGLHNTNISLIAPHPTDPATLYTASAGQPGIFESTDYGDTWSRLDGGQPDPPGIDNMIIDPGRPDTLYRATGDARVFQSGDGGATWTPAWPDFRFSAIYGLNVAPSDPDVLYAYRNGFGLFRSDDHGNAWGFLPQAAAGDVAALAVHPDNPAFVLSGGKNPPPGTPAELRRSRDGGQTWDTTLAVPDAVGITGAAFDPRVEPYFSRGNQPPDPTRLYAASTGPRGTLWYSNDAGDTWKTLNDALNFVNVRVLAIPHHRPGVLYAGTWGGGTWRTDDAGQSWHRLPGDPAASPAAIAVDPGNHNVLYIADSNAPHLHRSVDDGQTWELLFDAGPDYERLAALAIAPSDTGLLYVSALDGDDPPNGTVFRVDANLPLGENATDATGDLPGAPVSLAVHRHDSRRLFAVVPGAGAWKTLDQGASWRQITKGVPDVDFARIYVDPLWSDHLFLVGADQPLVGRYGLDPDEVYGIWKSTDDGDSWNKVGGTTFGRPSGPVKDIAFHPDDQQVMYAAGEGGVYLSPDRGETWTLINGRLPFVAMNAVATDGQTLYAGSAGAGAFAGAIHPLIYTADWQRHSPLSVPVHHVQITLHPEDPQTLYASAFPGGVFKSSDGGATWQERNAGLPSFAVPDPSRQGRYILAIAPSAPELLYAGLPGHGVYRSDDGALSWRPVLGQGNELQNVRVRALLVHPDDPQVLYAATDQGVWRTVDGGASWAEFGAGDVQALALGADDQLYAGTGGYGLHTRPAFHQAQDDTWRPLPGPGDGNLDQHISLLIHPDDSRILYAGTSRAGIFKTVDGGLTWREQNVGLAGDDVLTLAFHPSDPQTLYAGTTDGIARSLDGGAVWRPRDVGWPPRQQVVSIAFDPITPTTLYACSRNGSVMKSVDDGATWSTITTGLDQGLAFLKIAVDRFDPRILYLVTDRDGVYISHDGGETWSSWNEGLWSRVTGRHPQGLPDPLRFSASGRLLYLGTDGSGMWRRPAEGAP